MSFPAHKHHIHMHTQGIQPQFGSISELSHKRSTSRSFKFHTKKLSLKFFAQVPLQIIAQEKKYQC
uniref:Uncharacterized protein n=1 Tax=Arundo donax TaxID=35708 RepID=A0A0A9CAF1_ARUDO